MSKKQIEELSEAIFANCQAGLFKDEAYDIAEFVIEKQGYRKASEFFEEIEELFKNVTIPIVDVQGNIIPRRLGHWVIDRDDYATLKKKYTEESK